MSRLAGKAGNVFVASQLIEACESAWDEQVIANVTASLDTADYKVGSGSAKFVVADAKGTGLIGSEAIGSLDISGYTDVMAWVKSSVNMNATDWVLVLDDTALCASVLVVVGLPALVANTWKFVRFTVSLAAATAIISVGVRQDVDKGALSFWVDEVRAAKQIAGMKSWSIDQKVEVFETTAFDSGGNRQFIATVKGWSGSFEGYKDGAPLTIGTHIGLELRESATATQQYRGTAIITDFHAKTDVSGLVLYSYDFVGHHALEIATA